MSWLFGGPGVLLFDGKRPLFVLALLGLIGLNIWQIEGKLANRERPWRPPPTARRFSVNTHTRLLSFVKQGRSRSRRVERLIDGRTIPTTTGSRQEISTLVVCLTQRFFHSSRNKWRKFFFSPVEPKSLFTWRSESPLCFAKKENKNNNF